MSSLQGSIPFALPSCLLCEMAVSGKVADRGVHVLKAKWLSAFLWRGPHCCPGCRPCGRAGASCGLGPASRQPRSTAAVGCRWEPGRQAWRGRSLSGLTGGPARQSLRLPRAFRLGPPRGLGTTRADGKPLPSSCGRFGAENVQRASETKQEQTDTQEPPSGTDAGVEDRLRRPLRSGRAAGTRGTPRSSRGLREGGGGFWLRVGSCRRWGFGAARPSGVRGLPGPLGPSPGLCGDLRH